MSSFNFKKVADEYNDNIDAASSYYHSMYDNFRPMVDRIRSYSSIASDTFKPIDDESLEELLTSVPLILIDISEALADMQVRMNTVKLSLKDKKFRSKQDLVQSGEAKTSASELVAGEFYADELLVNIYQTVIDTVEHDLSYGRELVMGAKKIWDRRRDAENAVPIKESEPPSLPEYTAPSDRRYVHG